jgi:hypothetical protein
MSDEKGEALNHDVWATLSLVRASSWKGCGTVHGMNSTRGCWGLVLKCYESRTRQHEYVKY